MKDHSAHYQSSSSKFGLALLVPAFMPTTCCILLIGFLVSNTLTAATVFDTKIEDVVEQPNAGIIENLQNAAKSGSAKAALALGNRYYSGKGVEKNYQNALQWWQRSAELGSPQAAYNLGIAHTNGYGVPKDLGKARAAFAIAAEHQIAKAHLALGILTLDSAASPSQYLEAGQHFERAAALGNAAACHNLALLYENGLGYAKDLDQARYWQQRARESEKEEPNKQTAEVFDTNWVQSRPPSNYTLQLASGDTLEGTRKLIAKLSTLESAVFMKTLGGQPRYVAIAGDFPNYAEALMAIDKLPAMFLNYKPFAVKFKVLQRQINENTKVNN